MGPKFILAATLQMDGIQSAQFLSIECETKSPRKFFQRAFVTPDDFLLHQLFPVSDNEKFFHILYQKSSAL
jgi:hypothetical protein